MGEVINILVSVVAGGASGWLVARYRFRQERRAQSGDDAAAAIRQALVMLGELHDLYQGTAIGPKWRRPSMRQLAAQENAFQSACDQSALESLARAAHDYVDVGRAYASGDQDTAAVQEEAAWKNTAALMRQLIREAQAP